MGLHALADTDMLQKARDRHLLVLCRLFFAPCPCRGASQLKTVF